MNSKKEQALVKNSNSEVSKNFFKILKKLYSTIMYKEDLTKLKKFKSLGDLYYTFFSFYDTLSVTEVQQLKNQIKNSEKYLQKNEISIVQDIVLENMKDELIVNKKFLMYMNIFGEIPKLCESCDTFIESRNYSRHKENCKKYLKSHFHLNENEKNNNEITLEDKIFCLYCVQEFPDFQLLDIHINIHHMDEWKKSIQEEKLKWECRKDTKGEVVLCRDEIKTEKIVEVNTIQNDREVEKVSKIEEKIQNKDIESEDETKPKIKEQIPKHKKETTQYDEELDPDIITDEEQYQKDFIKKLQEDIKDFEESKREIFIKEVIIVRKKSDDKKTKELQDSIKDYLRQTYKGYCQVCGFRFLIAGGENEGRPSFVRFNWNDKRVVKQKKSFVTKADSLCLCRNCSANIKWGGFEPVFIDRINGIEDFANKSLDEIKDVICVELEDEVVERFKSDYEWDEIYALEIQVNDKLKNLYFTNGHLIQFIAYMQLEEG